MPTGAACQAFNALNPGVAFDDRAMRALIVTEGRALVIALHDLTVLSGL
jgi:hypothetical protein